MLVLDRILAPSAGVFVLYIFGVLVLSCLMRLTIENRILAARPGYARISGTGFLGPAERPDRDEGPIQSLGKRSRLSSPASEFRAQDHLELERNSDPNWRIALPEGLLGKIGKRCA